MVEKEQRAIEGYTIIKKGYKPTNGNLSASQPPTGGSGMETATSSGDSGNSGSSSDSGQSQSNNND